MMKEEVRDAKEGKEVECVDSYFFSRFIAGNKPFFDFLEDDSTVWIISL